MHILIVNGPNLNLIGNREPGIYGSLSFDNYLKSIKEKFPKISFTYFQSNVEGELINALQNANNFTGIILNAGGYTHTSIALADTVAAIETPVVEVHISNILAREEFRQTSFISKHAIGVITGFGLNSYELAVQYFLLNA